ncbi:MAG: galactokinase, partial [Saprospiraceae bacterium]|nr:galactokinase [Saprospiraceae bacterium]
RPVLAKVGQQAEHRFVGIKCGIMDQFASVMGKKDQVLLLDCRSLEYHYYPATMNPYTIVLLNSNVTHELASSEYNTRREECEESIELLKAHDPNLVNLRDLSLSKLEELKSSLTDKLYRRCRHVLSENNRVLQATAALSNSDFVKVGDLLYASHQSLRQDYEVSCEEIDFLAEQTQELDYVLGSRMMGGGFGGCTINLVHKNKVDAFIDLMDQKYFARFARHITPYLVTIEDGAKEIEETN